MHTKAGADVRHLCPHGKLCYKAFGRVTDPGRNRCDDCQVDASRGDT